ncbi:hypothetical protein [Natronococcus sp. A-GB7]|uniref:hypothetical protein n=1 Tax=Natronococcus sp. A-GB7 TaxID=3037649 RepID=UPI00241EEF8F|nr:hypothetical protein [Natronococcus sp. A-GB7]MDG5819526.1 hypothetical protein [Natronococcus sp. A-GB7]
MEGSDEISIGADGYVDDSVEAIGDVVVGARGYVDDDVVGRTVTLGRGTEVDGDVEETG